MQFFDEIQPDDAIRWADAILLLHGLFIAFVLFGLIFIIMGRIRQWQWVRNPWFRFCHLISILFVMIQSWFGLICPLTIWEMNLRSQAGDIVYHGSFIAHWIDKLIFYQAPSWVFILCYTLFGALVLASWYWVRPRSFGRHS